MSNRMKYAVTGGLGFIGQAVMRELANRGLSASAFDLADGFDIRDPDIHFGDANTVIHLAGLVGTSELFETPHLAVDTNIHGTLNVLQWCQRNGAGFVGITMPQVFPSVYTITKTCAVNLAKAWHQAYRMPVSHVRAFNAYGADQKFGGKHPQKIIPAFASLAWRNEPIPVWGDGSQGVDLIHVDELGRMLVDATAYVDGEVFDGGSGFMVSVKWVAERVIEVTGSTAGIQYLPMRKGEVSTQLKAEGLGWDELGWQPSFDMGKLDETILSYKPKKG